MAGRDPVLQDLLEGWMEATANSFEWDDCSIFFDTSNTSALQRRLTGPRESMLQCTWPNPAPKSWDRYFRTYSAGVRHIYLKDKPKAGLSDQDYVPPS